MSHKTVLKTGKATGGWEPAFYPSKGRHTLPHFFWLLQHGPRGAHMGSQNSHAAGMECKMAGHSYGASRLSCYYCIACKRRTRAMPRSTPVQPRFSIIAVSIHQGHGEANEKIDKAHLLHFPSVWLLPFEGSDHILTGVIRSVQTIGRLNGNI